MKAEEFRTKLALGEKEGGIYGINCLREILLLIIN